MVNGLIGKAKDIAMPKAKPVSLHPLNFDEAMSALLKVAPEKPKPKAKRKRKKPKR